MPYKNLYLMLKECDLCLMTLNSFREILYFLFLLTQITFF